MTKEEYELLVNKESDDFYNRLVEINNYALKNSINCKVGDFVFCLKNNTIYTVIEIDTYTNWMNLPIIRIFGSKYYKGKSRIGNKTFLYWYDLRMCTDQDLEVLNKNKRISVNKQRLNKYKTDSLYKLTATLRGRTRSAFNAKGVKKNSKTEQLLGIDFETVKKHIERQFKKGMTWDNHGHGNGKWQIDHIIPMASAKSEQELISLCHYTNLQPMWAPENQKKKDSVPQVQRKLTL